MGSSPTPPPEPPPDQGDASGAVTQAREHQMVGARAVRFVTERVQPPAALYVTADDGLYVSVSCVQAGVSLTLAGTILLPDGRVQANTWAVTAPSTGVPTSFLFPLVEGYLINCSVMPSAGLHYGGTWVFVAIRRGGLVSGINLQILMSANVDAYGGPSWPGSALATPTGGQGLDAFSYTAAGTLGTAFTYTTPAFARVLLRSMAVRFVCSAQVASRQIYVIVYDVLGQVQWQDVCATTVAASSNTLISWGLGMSANNTGTASDFSARGLPWMYLSGASQILFSAAALQSGDQFLNIDLHFEQWFAA